MRATGTRMTNAASLAILLPFLALGHSSPSATLNDISLKLNATREAFDKALAVLVQHRGDADVRQASNASCVTVLMPCAVQFLSLERLERTPQRSAT